MWNFPLFLIYILLTLVLFLTRVRIANCWRALKIILTTWNRGFKIIWHFCNFFRNKKNRSIVIPHHHHPRKRKNTILCVLFYIPRVNIIQKEKYMKIALKFMTIILYILPPSLHSLALMSFFINYSMFFIYKHFPSKRERKRNTFLT